MRKNTLLATAMALFCCSAVLGYLAYRAYTKPSFAATDERGGIRQLPGRAVMERLEKYQDHPEIAEFYALAKGEADKAKWRTIGYGLSAFLCVVAGGISLIAARRH